MVELLGEIWRIIRIILNMILAFTFVFFFLGSQAIFKILGHNLSDGSAFKITLSLMGILFVWVLWDWIIWPVLKFFVKVCFSLFTVLCLFLSVLWVLKHAHVLALW